MVKELWRFAYATKDVEVSTVILKLLIKVTQQILAATIGCLDESMVMENGYKLSVGSTKINMQLFEDPKVNTIAIHLKPIYRALFKIIIGCVVPKGDYVDHSTRAIRD